MTPVLKRLALAMVLIPLACKREAPPPPPTTAPATRAATKPAKPAPTTSYVDVIRAAYPKMPATQPLGVPVDLIDAGHYVLSDPVYVCPRGDLWIARPDAPPLESALKKAGDDQVHLVPQRVYLVAWATDENGKLFPRIVIKNTGGTFEWIDGPERRPATAGRPYRWEDALFFGDDRVVVPTNRGVSIFTFSPQFGEEYRDVVTSADAADAGGANPPQVLGDGSGLLAWSPWDGVKPGGLGVLRWADGKWTELNAKNFDWPDKILHLVPLLDGSVLQLYRDDLKGPVKLGLSTLTAGTVDEKAIMALVEQLSDEDPVKRAAAFAELTRYGPASWPVLEKLSPDQPPAARVRLEQLLSTKSDPTLGGRKPVDGNMRLVSRFDDGGILLYLAGGVRITQEDKTPQLIKPAWISIRPGRAIELLEPVLVKEADPDKQRFFAFGDEWIVSDAAQGPRRLFGNHLEAMLGKDETAWQHVVGADRRGRWLFRKSASPDDSQTLLLDPTLPDPTPKLPVWLINVPQGVTGWNRENYPVEKAGDAWALYERGWRPLDKKKDELIAELPKSHAPPPPPKPATTSTPTTTTTPTTTQDSLGPPILIDTDGASYYDGKDRLVIIDSGGKRIDWPLPANAVGSGDVTLLRTADGLLFLFNQPGRVVRIKPTPQGEAPFLVEAVFTHRIPQPEHVARIWLDPAGRIVMAYDKHFLAIMFPQGRIPREIMVLIPAKELEGEGK